jgi:hypothetical protein
MIDIGIIPIDQVFCESGGIFCPASVSIDD